MNYANRTKSYARKNLRVWFFFHRRELKSRSINLNEYLSQGHGRLRQLRMAEKGKKSFTDIKKKAFTESEVD